MKRFFNLSILIAPVFITLFIATIWIRSYQAVELFYAGNRWAICSNTGELAFIFTDAPTPAPPFIFEAGSSLFVQTGPSQVTQIGTRTGIPYWFITLVVASVSIVTFLARWRSTRRKCLTTVGFEPVILS